MSSQDPWQLAHDDAVAYEKDFVPAIFAQWPPVLAEVAAGLIDDASYQKVLKAVRQALREFCGRPIVL